MKIPILTPKISELALAENLTLTSEHKILITLIQQFYAEFNIVPSTRALINYAKDQKFMLDSLEFAKLFPKGIAQACKIADLPVAGRCI